MMLRSLGLMSEMIIQTPAQLERHFGRTTAGRVVRGPGSSGSDGTGRGLTLGKNVAIQPVKMRRPRARIGVKEGPDYAQNRREAAEAQSR
jgi:hypothetical protein